MPNWAVREKLLDKFLVGGKPVPDRVFDVSVAAMPCAMIYTTNDNATTAAMTSITTTTATTSTHHRPADRTTLP